MTTVSDIMTRDLVTVEPEMSFREALDVLRSARVYGAPVVQSGRVTGVLSVTDILEFEATHPGVPTERPQDVERLDLVTHEEWMEEDDAPAAFFVDLWADAGADVTERFHTSESPEWDQLEEHVVSQVMTRKVVSLPPDAEVREAARLMIEFEIHRVLIVDGGDLRGIVTSIDVVRAVAEGRDLSAESGTEASGAPGGSDAASWGSS